MQDILAFAMPGFSEWLIIGAIALLLFGKRLPEVGRSLGKGIVEFKKGLKGIEDDLDDASTPATKAKIEDKQAFKFDPYTGKQVDQSAGQQ